MTSEVIAALVGALAGGLISGISTYIASVEISKKISTTMPQRSFDFLLYLFQENYINKTKMFI